MRRIIAALHVTLDGCIEGPQGETDWIEDWEDAYDLLAQVDTFVLGAGMYPGYEQYWSAVLAAPRAALPFSGRPATPGEIDYANHARRTPHVVLSSKTLQDAAWDNTRIVRSLDDIRQLKQQPGKDIHAVGGAALVSSLLEANLIDELRLAIHPIVLGRGKRLFTQAVQRHALEFMQSRSMPGGVMELSYRVKETS
jgi:dihydrofolate reductase